MIGGKFANGAVTAAMAYAFNQLAPKAGDQRRKSAIVNAATARELSEEDFVTLFPSYEEHVDLIDLAFAKHHLKQDFIVHFIENDLQELINQGYQEVRNEYLSAGLGAIKANRHTFSLISARAGLSAQQTRLVTDISMVASHLDGLDATTSNLSRLAEQIRQNPEMFE